MNTTSAALCSQSLTTADLCYAVILAAKEGDSNRALLLATGLHARIRGLEGQLRDEIATNAARIEGEDTQKFCKRLARENEALRLQLHDEIDANTAFREAGGALPDEDMPTFCTRLIRERDELSAALSAQA